MKQWNPAAYGAEIERLLTKLGGGNRLIPLTAQPCVSDAARKEISIRSAALWLPDARAPVAALAGVHSFFSDHGGGSQEWKGYWSSCWWACQCWAGRVGFTARRPMRRQYLLPTSNARLW